MQSLTLIFTRYRPHLVPSPPHSESPFRVTLPRDPSDFLVRVVTRSKAHQRPAKGSRLDWTTEPLGHWISHSRKSKKQSILILGPLTGSLTIDSCTVGHSRPLQRSIAFAFRCLPNCPQSIATNASSSRRHLPPPPPSSPPLTTFTTTLIITINTTTTTTIAFSFCVPLLPFLCNNPSCPSLILLRPSRPATSTQTRPPPVDLSFFRSPSSRQSSFLSSFFPNTSAVNSTPRQHASSDPHHCHTVFSSSLGGFLCFPFPSFISSPSSPTRGLWRFSKRLCTILDQIWTPFRLLSGFSM